MDVFLSFLSWVPQLLITGHDMKEMTLFSTLTRAMQCVCVCVFITFHSVIHFLLLIMFYSLVQRCPAKGDALII